MNGSAISRISMAGQHAHDPIFEASCKATAFITVEHAHVVAEARSMPAALPDAAVIAPPTTRATSTPVFDYFAYLPAMRLTTSDRSQRYRP
jgi:hypothetical protein